MTRLAATSSLSLPSLFLRALRALRGKNSILFTCPLSKLYAEDGLTTELTESTEMGQGNKPGHRATKISVMAK